MPDISDSFWNRNAGKIVGTVVGLLIAYTALRSTLLAQHRSSASNPSKIRSAQKGVTHVSWPDPLEMVEAGGVGIFRAVENRQLIDFLTR